MYMRILIATGIYPPDIGGPAQYAFNVEKVWKNWGHRVTVKSFRFERALPTGLRHAMFFLKCIPSALRSDFIFALDTWSAALPAVFLGWLFRKKIIIRAGGDFLWESYVERTGELVPWSKFYRSHPRFSFKEKLIFFLTKTALRRASAVAFNSDWQRTGMIPVYGLNPDKTSVILNFFGDSLPSRLPSGKNFIWAARPIRLKNGSNLKKAFAQALAVDGALTLDERVTSHEELLNRLASCYAVILPSISEMSPNFILDALRFGKPFIMTRETGLYELLKDIGLFVDPLSVPDISEKILMLADAKTYALYQSKTQHFSFRHSWEEIAKEFLALYKKL